MVCVCYSCFHWSFPCGLGVVAVAGEWDVCHEEFAHAWQYMLNAVSKIIVAIRIALNVWLCWVPTAHLTDPLQF